MSWVILILSVVGFVIHRLLGEEHRRAMERALKLALALGLAGLFAGLLGPMLLPPDATDGPLWRVVISGPMGFAVGLLLGLAREVLRRRATEA